MKFHRVKSCHGDSLGFNKEKNTFCLYHNQEECHDFEEIIAFTSSKFKDFIFIFPKKTKHNHIKLKDYSFFNNIYPFYIRKVYNHYYHFIDIFRSHYLSCPPTSVEWSYHQEWYDYNWHIAHVSLQKHAHDWECLILDEITDICCDAWYEDFALYIDEYFSQNIEIEHINKIIFAPIQKEDKVSLLNLIAPFIDLELFQDLAKKTCNDETYALLLNEKLGEDFWLKDAINPLLHWYHTQRNISQTINVNEKYDFLHQKHNERESASFLEELNYQIRRQIKPLHKSCIVTTIRNEGLYLLPWIAWHKQLGFEHFFIYSNENDDGSDEILRILSQAGIITWLKNDMGPWVPTHFKILKHAFAICPEILNYEWCFVCDVDEYLQFKNDIFTNLKQFLDYFKNSQTDAIMFHWRTLTAEDKINYIDAEIIERNLSYLKHDYHNGFKMMGRSSHIIGGDAHILFCSDKENWTYRFPSKEKILYQVRSADVREDCHDYSIAFLLHYYMRSSKEFLLRLYRGDAFDPHRVMELSHGMFMKNHKIKDFNRLYNQTIGEISQEERPNNPTSQEILHQLMALPHMKEAKDTVISITSKRIDILLAYLKENIHELGEDWQLFLHNLEENHPT